MKSILLFLSFLVLSTSAHAQATPETLIATFFKEHATNPGQALQNLYDTNPWSTTLQEGIDGIKTELNRYNVDLVGKMHGVELITTKKVTESLVLYSYLMKYDRLPMRITFKFYKPDDTWMLTGFNFDNGLDDELTEAAKLQNLGLKGVN